MYDKLRLINHHWPHPAAGNPWYSPAATNTSGTAQPHPMHPNGFSTAAAAAVLSASMLPGQVQNYNHEQANLIASQISPATVPGGLAGLDPNNQAAVMYLSDMQHHSKGMPFVISHGATIKSPPADDCPVDVGLQAHGHLSPSDHPDAIGRGRFNLC